MVFRALIFVLQELAQVRTRFYSPLKKRFPLRMPEVSHPSNQELLKMSQKALEQASVAGQLKEGENNPVPTLMAEESTGENTESTTYPALVFV